MYAFDYTLTLQNTLRIFVYPAIENELDFRCVAHFYAFVLFSNATDKFFKRL